MVRYLNVTRNGLKVGTRRTKRSLGMVDVPKYSLEINVVLYVFDYFFRAGLIEYAEGMWRLTNRGFNAMCANKHWRK